MGIEGITVIKSHCYNSSCRGLLCLPELISPIGTLMYRHHTGSKGISLQLSVFSRSALSATAMDLNIQGVVYLTSARHF